MIIPPAAITFGVLVVITKLVLAGLFNDSSKSESTTRTNSAESVLVTSCRYKSTTVPFRDLSPIPESSNDEESNEVDESEISSRNTKDSNQEAERVERPAVDPRSEAETPENTEE